MKRSATTFHQFVQRIPADVKDRVRGMILVVPIGEETVTLTISPKAQDIRLSLRTRDPAEAKVRQACVLRYLEGIWCAVRQGPRPLSQKQIIALAGVLYREHMALAADEPGAPIVWQHVVTIHRKAQEAGKLEEWIGAEVDALLAREGILTDAESRIRLMKAASEAEIQASMVLERHAEGDYTPDAAAARFPDWTPIADRTEITRPQANEHPPVATQALVALDAALGDAVFDVAPDQGLPAAALVVGLNGVELGRAAAARSSLALTYARHGIDDILDGPGFPSDEPSTYTTKVSDCGFPEDGGLAGVGLVFGGGGGRSKDTGHGPGGSAGMVGLMEVLSIDSQVLR